MVSFKFYLTQLSGMTVPGSRGETKKANKSHELIGSLIKLLLTVMRQTLIPAGRNGVDNTSGHRE